MGAYDSSKRIFYYDVLSALEIILIITSHICREFAQEWPVHSLKFIASAGWMDIAVLGVPYF